MSTPVITDAQCELLTDEHYYDALRYTIQKAIRRCFITMFIIDIKSYCATNCVLELINDLAEAQWRGVDVRVIIGGSRSTFAIAEAAAIAHDELLYRGIPSIWLTSNREAKGSHSKTVIVDETVMLGSHNWSPGAFYTQTQDSIRIISPALAEYLAGQFELLWRENNA